MNKDKTLSISKIIFIIGIAIVACAIFIDTVKVASLSGLNSDIASIKLEKNEKYKIDPPDKPVDESGGILIPKRPGANATDTDRSDYDKEKKEYDEKVKKLKEEHKESYKKYKLEYDNHLQAVRKLNFQKRKEKAQYKERERTLQSEIKHQKININYIMLTTIIRFLGSLLLILGSLGILILGDKYERVGVLVTIGFAFKTIIGL